jgi:MFS transporter, UMF1 family
MLLCGEEAKYFGPFEYSERGTSWLGAVAFADVQLAPGSYREVILLLVAIRGGLVMPTALNVRRAFVEVGKASPAQICGDTR